MKLALTILTCLLHINLFCMEIDKEKIIAHHIGNSKIDYLVNMLLLNKTLLQDFKYTEKINNSENTYTRPALVENVTQQIFDYVFYNPELKEMLHLKTQIPCTYTLNGHDRYVFSVAYSPDGKQLASASYDNTIKLWAPHTGKLTRTLNSHDKSHDKWVNSVAYSPDSEQLASASYDNTIKLWAPHTGALTHTLNGHDKCVNSVVYSPDGKQLTSGSDDNTIKLWNPHTGQLIHTINDSTDKVSSVAYKPDGKELASGEDDGSIKLWGLNHINKLQKILQKDEHQQLNPIEKIKLFVLTKYLQQHPNKQLTFKDVDDDEIDPILN